MTAPLVSVETLAASSPSAGLLDIRWSLTGPPGREQYAQGHIPGAVFIDLDRELAGPPGAGGRHPLPTAADFEAAMQAAGVDNDRPVVVYDGANSQAAARAWWLLRYFGHRDVTVLDGGLAAWTLARYPLTREVPAPPRGDFVARPGRMPVLSAEGAAALAARGVLVDARAPERFRGEKEPIDPVAGHIPRARNVPAALTTQPSGRLLDVPALRELFGGVGVRDAVEVGAYCGSGVTAAHTVLALELAGFNAALYPGSWSEWITDPGRPTAQGP